VSGPLIEVVEMPRNPYGPGFSEELMIRQLSSDVTTIFFSAGAQSKITIKVVGSPEEPPEKIVADIVERVKAAKDPLVAAGEWLSILTNAITEAVR